jgi:hypothetical protein
MAKSSTTARAADDTAQAAAQATSVEETSQEGATKAEDNAKATAGDSDKAVEEAEAKMKTVSLRHKTQFPTYGRAGIRVTRQAKDYRVTAEQLAALKADANVEVVEK